LLSKPAQKGIDYRFPVVSLTAGQGLEAFVRKADDHAYAWIRPYPRFLTSNRYQKGAGRDGFVVKDFDPMSEETPARFSQVEGATLPLRQMTNGLYDVSLWETWGDTSVKRWLETNTENTLIIRLPALERDMAIKVRRVGEDPFHAGASQAP